MTFRSITPRIVFSLLLAGCSHRGDNRGPSEQPTVPQVSTDRTQRLQRLYVPLRDGVRLAVDLWLPELAATQTVPCVLRATRYGRSHGAPGISAEDDENAAEATRWAERGYALVLVDARGSGASFGSRPEGDLSEDEIQDYGEILTWIAAQAWSTGRVGAYGASYDGDTAELMSRLGNPALKAIAPQFSDYDPYRQLVFPGGAYAEGPLSQWLLLTDILDGVEGSVERYAEQVGIAVEALEQAVKAMAPLPVDGPSGPDLLEAARLEHQANLRQDDDLPARENFDDRWQMLAVATHRPEIEASGVPLFVQSSWFDAGTAAGTLERFATFSNYQEVWIGPWSHGGELVLDLAGTQPLLEFEDLSFDEQFGRLADFFDRFVRDGKSPPEGKVLHFTTLDSSGWTDAYQWPADNVEDSVLYLSADGMQSEPSAGDTLELLTALHSSGVANRWAMNAGAGPADYSNWSSGAESRLSFAGPELSTDTQILGFPVVVAEVAGEESDGVLHAYLEQITEDGTPRYLTEGRLRLSHRGTTLPPIRTDLPVERSFLARDRLDMGQGAPTTLVFELLPISATLQAGTRLQLSFATSDVGNFASYGPTNSPSTLFVGGSEASRLVLPVVRESAGASTLGAEAVGAACCPAEEVESRTTHAWGQGRRAGLGPPWPRAPVPPVPPSR